MADTSTRSHRLFQLALLIALLAPLTLVRAEIQRTGWYGSFFYSDSVDRFKPALGPTTEVNKGHIKIKGGKLLSDSLSLEGQFGLTTNSGNKRGLVSYGLYLRAGYPLGNYFPYGLLGYSGVHAYSDVAPNVTESGGSYGLGIDIFGNKNVAISFEYLRLIDKSVNGGKYNFDTLGIGFTYFFTDDTSYFSRNRKRIKSIRY